MNGMKTFELCVPAYNEAAIIQDALARIRNVLVTASMLDWRITVADNASTDGTAQRVEGMDDARIRAVRIDEKGKGRAIVGVATQNSTQLFGFIDADLSADPADIVPLLAPILADEADVVVGSRLLDRRVVARGPLRTVSSRIFNYARRAIVGVSVSDSQCGLKVMNERGREVLGTCVETGWFLDIEFLAKAEHLGLRIREVPVHWNEEAFVGRVSKLRLVRDGIGAIVAMVRIRARLATL